MRWVDYIQKWEDHFQGSTYLQGRDPGDEGSVPLSTLSPHLIGLGHRARQGKDTLADLLQQNLRLQGGTCRVYSLATQLKMLARTLGMKGKDPKGLQLLGDAIRRFDQDYFIKQVTAQIDEDGCNFAIITDVRRLNEARWVKAQGGLLVKVQRLKDGLPFVAMDRDAEHGSESELVEFVFDENVAAESGDLDGLRKAAQWLADVTLGLRR